MKITISIIKADIGSIGGHVKPSEKILDAVKNHINDNGNGLVIDYYVGYTGDDIFILTTHQKGKDNSEVHQLAWNAFIKGTNMAKSQGLYGAGQDLLSDSFSGNIKGMGPAIAELEFDERENEPFLVFTADKTDPGAYNLPLYLSFSDPMHNAGLILSSKIGKGYTFNIMDVSYSDRDRLIELNTPEDIYSIAALLRDNERFVVEQIHARSSGEQAVAASTTRLHNIAGKYVGKDDPVLLTRVQGPFPATGEILSPYSIGHYVAGFMRGSHTGPMMPVKQNSPVSFFDGPPLVSCLAFCIREGKLTEPVDCFDQPFWDHIRDKVSRKALDIREQGFSGASMLPYSELEYGGIVDILESLEDKFKLR